MVTPCSYWIWSSTHETPAIARSDRLERLTSSLPQDEPAPSLVLMVGYPILSTTLFLRRCFLFLCLRSGGPENNLPANDRLVSEGIPVAFRPPPQVLIVLAGCRLKQRDVGTAAQTFGSLVGGIAGPAARDPHVPEVSFLRLRHMRRFGAVLPSLESRAQAVRQKRQQARALFSVRHFKSLFDRAFDGVAALSNAPLIASGRQGKTCLSRPTWPLT